MHVRYLGLVGWRRWHGIAGGLFLAGEKFVRSTAVKEESCAVHLGAMRFIASFLFRPVPLRDSGTFRSPMVNSMGTTTVTRADWELVTRKSAPHFKLFKRFLASQLVCLWMRII